MIKFMHKLVLGLYPAGFRRTWGAELEAVSAQAAAAIDSRGTERRGAGGPGARETAATHATLLLDAVRMLPLAWLDQRSHTKRVIANTTSPENGPRSRWPKRAFDSARQDVRYTFNQWRHSPMFTAFAIATLAIGIGAVVAIFSVINGVLLRPLPYRDANQIVIANNRFPFWADLPTLDGASTLQSYTTWQGWRAAFPETDGSVGVRLSASVGANYFDLLGVKPALGRLFDARDAQAAGDPVVLSWGAWQRDFGGARDALGKRVVMDGKTYSVIGVTPRDFEDPLAFPVNDIESAMFRVLTPPPIAVRSLRPGPGVGIIARLRAGATPADAGAEMTRLLQADYAHANIKPQFDIITAADARTASVRSTLGVLAVAVAVLLLIGCVNAANLLLSRAAVRRREITVRLALGAARTRLIAQLLTESLMLALVASAFGTWIGYVGSRAIVAFGDTAVPRGNDVALDYRVLLFALAAAVVTSVLFGLIPALHTSNVPHASVLREEGRGNTSGRGAHLRGILVVTEIALAVSLTFGAGLLVHSLWNLQHVDPGYQTENVLTLRVTMAPQRFKPDQRVMLHDQIVERIAAQPGVVKAAAVTFHPLSGGGIPMPIGAPSGDPSAQPTTDFLSITPDYFDAMGIPILRGRSVNHGDNAGGERVVVISASLAKKVFNTTNAVDRTVTLGGAPYRVVGVVGDVKEFSVASDNGDGIAYVSYAQTPPEAAAPSSSIIVRGRGDAHELSAVSRAAIRDVEPTIPIAFIRTMKDMLNIDLLAPRLRTVLITAFGAIAALLAALGLLGVMAYTVSQARAEISVRMALGARSQQVALQVVQHAIRLAVGGVAIGVVIALVGARALAAFLFGVPISDWLVLGSVVAGSMMLAIAAAWYPAYRAARVDPATVLRSL